MLPFGPRGYGRSDRCREPLRPGHRDQEYTLCDKTPSGRGFVSDNCVGFAVQTLSRCAFRVIKLMNQCTRGLTRGGVDSGLRRYIECPQVRERLGYRGFDRCPLIRRSMAGISSGFSFPPDAVSQINICVRDLCIAKSGARGPQQTMAERVGVEPPTDSLGNLSQ